MNTGPRSSLRFDWAKLLAPNERTADGYRFSSWDVITDRVRFVRDAQTGAWQYRRCWKPRSARRRASRRRRPFCGAKTRQGTPCQARVVEDKARCARHGGASTGPTSAEGRARIAESNRRRAEAKRAEARAAAAA